MNAVYMSDREFSRFLVGCEVGALVAVVTEVDDEVDGNHIVLLEVLSIPELQPMEPQVPVRL